MSILVDKFIKESSNNQVEINNKWYIAKPILNTTLKNKLKDCIKILRNKAVAVHFKEGEEGRK